MVTRAGNPRPIRVLLAKMGLDCHDTAMIALGQALRDSGMEVVYLGLHNSAQKIVNAAIQEDVDVVGLSFLSGQHLPQTRKLVLAMEAEALRDVLLLVGGVIPRDDIPRLKSMGVAEVFTPGTMSREVVEYIRAHVGAAPARA